MRILCVILARAGSKGLLDKNVRPLAGKPLVAWSIGHALESRRVDRVVLSTDGPLIAEVGHRYGVEVIDRPAELASDTSPVVAAVKHAVEAVENQEGKPYKVVVVLYGNVPLRPGDLIDRAVEKLVTSGAHSVQSVCPVGKAHPYWMKTLGGTEGDVLLAYQLNQVDRRQDLPPVYQLDGGIIVVRRENLSHDVRPGPHAFLGTDQRAVVTGPGQVVDVDTAADLAVAKAMMASGDGRCGESSGSSIAPAMLPTNTTMTIAGRTVGHGQPAYVIAELGVNHDGQLDRALALTEAAKMAGANAAKLQLFDPGLLLSDEAALAQYQKASAKDVHEMLASMQLSVDEMRAVRDAARRLGLGFIVTCFSVELVDQVKALEVDAIKVASPDAVNLPLIEALLALDKPMLISTGACELSELEAAVSLCAGRSWAALQCVSAYPVPQGQAALRGIDALRSICPLVGYSDHTTVLETGVWAVMRGACVIEKHLTYDCGASGPDHAASLDPDQFKRYVAMIRKGELELGPMCKTVQDCEREVRSLSRQSVCTVVDMPAGHVIAIADVTAKRPGTGIPAAKWVEVVGRTLKKQVKKNHLLREEDLES